MSQPKLVAVETATFAGVPMAQILDKQGNLVGELPEITDAQLKSLFVSMVRTRTFNEKAMKLQRTGRIPFYYACTGMEAHAAVPIALRDKDWIFIAYREQGLRLARGISIQEELAVFAGKPFAAWNPLDYRVTPLNATIGTHLPHATGYGYANRLLGGDDIALAIFGDGATSEVDFHSALNNAGVWKTPTVFFCQNNLYAQSTPLREQTASQTLAIKAEAYGINSIRIDGMDPLTVYSAVAEAAERARNGDGPTLIESVCYRYESHSTYDGTPVYRTRQEEDEWRPKDPLIRLRRLLENRSVISAADEEKIIAEAKAEIDAAMDALDAMVMPPRSRLFKTVTTKMPRRLHEQLNRDEANAGESLTTAAELSILNPGEELEPQGDRKSMTMVEALNAALDHGMKSNDRMIIMGEDVGREGGVFRVTENLYERYGPDRLLDTPLCELGIVGSAVGMAIAGAKPVCEIEFAGFGLTAFDQTVFHAGRYHWRSAGAFKMPLVIRTPAAGGHEGLEGHSDSPEAFYAHAQGLTIVYPANAYDAKGLLAAALESEDPIIFFEPVAQYFVKQDGIPLDNYTIPIGKAKVVRKGSDISIITYGNAVHICADAADTLESQGDSVEIIDLRTLKPWDEETVLESVKKTGRLVVVHEAAMSGGLGAEIIATVAEKACDFLETPPRRVAHADMVWAVAKLEPYSMISPDAVINAVREVLED